MPYTPNSKWTNYINSIFRDDPQFISEWRLDNISGGTALDSQGGNTLTASGSPTQVAGQMLVSGVQFDGVNDCFYITDATDTGIYPFHPSTDYKIGFIANLYVDDFSQERVIFSKWDTSNVDTSNFMLSITPESGLRLRLNQQSAATTVNHFDSISDIIPSGTWFKFAFSLMQRANSHRNWHIWVNDYLWCSVTGDIVNQADEDGTGVFTLGACNPLNNPSGFFSGKMENVLFFNGRGVRPEEYNYWSSGLFPSGTRPALNTFHPYLEGHFKLNRIEPAAGGQLAFVNEKVNNQYIYVSGSNSGLVLPLPGAADGTYGSGLGFPGINSNSKLARHVLTIPHDTIDMNSSFTVSMWMRPEIGGGVTRSFFGIRNTLEVGLSSTMIPKYTWFQQDGSSRNVQPSTTERIGKSNWSHVVYVCDIAKCSGAFYVSGNFINSVTLLGSALFSANKDSSPAPQAFFIGGIDNVDNAFSGILDEIIIFKYPLNSGEVSQLYNSQSGFLTINGDSSGIIGGLIVGNEFPVSGLLGGYVKGSTTRSGIIGGYVSGTGAIGNALLGGYTLGLEANPLSSDFESFFMVKGLYNTDFDSQIKIIKNNNTDFDAKVFIYQEELKPVVDIFFPASTQSGLAPLTYTFEARASGLNNKSIVHTQWLFSDIPITSGSVTTSSGTYRTSHTFSRSGLFNVVFFAMDDAGLISSDKIIINTASGITTPSVTLYASPLSGISPLTCTFSGVVDSSPRTIKNKAIYFGDGTASSVVSGVRHIYQAPGNYIAVFRVDDSSGIIATDTVELGQNN